MATHGSGQNTGRAHVRTPSRVPGGVGATLSARSAVEQHARGGGATWRCFGKGPASMKEWRQQAAVRRGGVG
jgi:hypothetical protein